MPSLGEEFRLAREARGLSLSDVAEHIHIRATYLEAIEIEDWPTIGAPVYVRGFLRTYARFLGVDAERAVETFNAAVPSAPPTRQTNAPPVGTARPGRSPSVWAWLGGAVAIALLAYVGYGYYQLKTGVPVAVATAIPSGSVASAEASPPAVEAAPSSGESVAVESSPTAAASGDAMPTTAATLPPSAPPKRAVNMRLTQPSWLRVAVDGKVVLQGVLPAGTVRDFRGKHVHLVAGNAGGVEIAAPGHAAKPLGSAGEVVERDYDLARDLPQE